MRRVGLFAVLLISLDQATKVWAAAHLRGQFLLLAPGWGLTYKVNSGIWLNQSLPAHHLLWLQVLSLLVLAAGGLYVTFYRRHYRRSLLVDLAFAALLAESAGNLFLDRLLAHGARDFLITPIAVCNLADLYGFVLFLPLVALEFLLYPPSRRLLRWTPPSRWPREGRLVWRTFLHQMRRRA